MKNYLTRVVYLSKNILPLILLGGGAYLLLTAQKDDQQFSYGGGGLSSGLDYGNPSDLTTQPNYTYAFGAPSFPTMPTETTSADTKKATKASNNFTGVVYTPYGGVSTQYPSSYSSGSGSFSGKSSLSGSKAAESEQRATALMNKINTKKSTKTTPSSSSGRDLTDSPAYKGKKYNWS